MNYGKKLKELREESEVSQEDVAKALGIKRSSYNQFEQQYDIIPTERINQVANYFNVSIDYTLGLSLERRYINSRNDINISLSAKRLKEFRKEKRITQMKLSDFLGASQHVIVYYEAGKNFISIAYLYTICKEYKISADYLLGKIDKPVYLKED